MNSETCFSSLSELLGLEKADEDDLYSALDWLVEKQALMGKYFNITITEESFSYSRNEAVISSESALDGVYIIRTSVRAETLNAAQTVRAYKSLAQVEQAFRSYKTVINSSLRVWRLP